MPGRSLNQFIHHVIHPARNILRRFLNVFCCVRLAFVLKANDWSAFTGNRISNQALLITRNVRPGVVSPQQSVSRKRDFLKESGADRSRLWFPRFRASAFPQFAKLAWVTYDGGKVPEVRATHVIIAPRSVSVGRGTPRVWEKWREKGSRQIN